MKAHKQLFIALTAVLALSFATPNVVHAKKEKAPAVEVIETTKSGRKEPKIKSSPKASKDLNKALDFIQKEQYDKAAPLLDGVIGNSKSTPYDLSKGYQLKANVLYFQDKIDESIEATRESIKADGLSNVEHLQAKFQVAQLLVSQERYPEAVEAFANFEADAIKIKGDEYAMLASAYYYQDQYKEAIAAIDKALASSEEVKKPWIQIRANSLYQGEDFEGTITYMKELLAKTPEERQWLSLLVSSYLSLEKYPEATAALLEAKGRGLLDNEAMWTQLYQLYMYQDNFAEAAAAMEEGIGKGFLKNDAKQLTQLGQNYYYAAQEIEGKPESKPMLEKASAAFKRAVDLKDKMGEPELWLAQIALFEQEDSAAARDFAKAALTKELQKKGSAYYYLGVAEHQLDNNAAAKAALIEAQKYPETKSQATSYLKNLK